MHTNNDLSLAQPLPLTPEPGRRILGALYAFLASLAQPSRPASMAVPAPSATTAEVPMYGQAFVTERDALAWSASAIAEGHRTVVEQNAYDYSWQVDVYPASGDDTGCAPAGPSVA